MCEEAVEVRVQYADWSDRARAGMSSPAGEAGLTAALSDTGGISLYLERDPRGALLHVEVSDDDARKLYEFFRAQFGEPPRHGAGGGGPPEGPPMADSPALEHTNRVS